LTGEITMRLSKRTLKKACNLKLKRAWEIYWKELEFFLKIGEAQKKYYALLPYRPRGYIPNFISLRR
jgi:hypothetical protein